MNAKNIKMNHIVIAKRNANSVPESGGSRKISMESMLSTFYFIRHQIKQTIKIKKHIG